MDEIGIGDLAPWRLLVTGKGSPAGNMALDCAILRAVVERSSGPTVRIYTWDGPAVSIGRFQDARATLRWDFLSRRSLPVVRRPTGGRGVLHGGDLTVSVAAPVHALAKTGSSVLASHFVVMDAVAGALRRLGAEALVGSGMRGATHSDCFASSCGADVVAPDGAKLAGGAQTRHRDCLLEQISIRWRPTEVEPEQVFVGAGPTSAYPFESVSEDDLVLSVVSALQGTLAANLERGTLSEIEVSQTNLRMSEYVVDLSPLM